VLFNSWIFVLAFLPATLAVASALRRHLSLGPLVVWLALASLAFYALWSPRHVPLLLGSILFNFWVGRAIASRRRAAEPVRGWLAFGVAIDLAVLAAFKYAAFIVENANAVTGATLPVPVVELPVGVSFYTFTQIAFLVDVSRGEASEYGLQRFTLFVSYFPHLVAGPVIHHRRVIPQFAAPRFCRFEAPDVLAGSCLFAIGLAKKVLLADPLAPFADAVFNGASAGIPLTLWESWGGMLAYSLQLYFDFSGYSDMALGLSRLLGVDLPVNFNSPYRAGSIIEFWRRWHITLSRFLRDYLYIPLGGNRRGPIRRYLNLMATMLLGGLWHGAAWTYVVWGGFHGMLLLVNHAWRAWRTGRPASRISLPTFLWTLLTFVAVTVGWAFFRAGSLTAALDVLQSAFGGRGLALPQSLAPARDWLVTVVPGIDWTFSGMFSNALTENVWLWTTLTGCALAIALAAPNSMAIADYVTADARAGESTGRPRSVRLPRWSVVAGLGVICALSLARLQANSPFIYYQF